MRREIVGMLFVLVLVVSLVMGGLRATPAQAASSGPNNGSSFADDSSVGSVSWSSPGNAQTSDDSYATANLNKNEVSHYLKATGFGFNIPAGATINGIQVDVEKRGGAEGKIGDNSVRLVKNGTIDGDEKSAAEVWPAPGSEAYTNYGNSTDLWGLNWTPADINSADFGFVISAKFIGTGSNKDADVDHIRITVYYSTANSAPTDIALSNSSVAENQPANTVVGTLSTTDPDVGDTFTYTLVSGTGDTDNASFNILNDSLRTSEGFDYETKNSYSIRVRSTDQGGLWVEKQFTITVTNVNEAPVANPQSGLTVDSCSNLTITLTGNDPENDPLTYIISTLPSHGDLYDGTGTGGTHITSVPYTVTDASHKVTYKPNASYSGADSFGFKVSDGALDSAEATISITVIGCDDGIGCTIDECQGGVCTHTPDDNLCPADGWADTGNTQWVEDLPCTEKEQKEQEYRDYYCDELSGCTYNVTNTQWVDTGSTRNKDDGTPCPDDGIDCTIDTCENGQCVHTPEDLDQDGYTVCQGDCNDSNASVHPNATEVCNGIDDDCDTLIDDADPSCTGQATWYQDSDGDNYGNATVSQQACNQSPGYVSDNTDCDDNDANEHPNQTWYKDADNDGYSDGTTDITSCTRPTGYKVASELTATTGDCDDSNASINPGATEVYNGIDDNCDGRLILETATDTGTATLSAGSGTMEDLTAITENTLPSEAAEGKPNLEFPHGFFSFNITGLASGATVTVTIALPSAVPIGTQYWKYGPTPANPTNHWYQLPMGDDDGDNVITITLVDGGLGDDDLTANGVIVDPGGPGNPGGPSSECEECGPGSPCVLPIPECQTETAGGGLLWSILGTTYIMGKAVGDVTEHIAGTLGCFVDELAVPTFGVIGVLAEGLGGLISGVGELVGMSDIFDPLGEMLSGLGNIIKDALPS